MSVTVRIAPDSTATSSVVSPRITTAVIQVLV